MRRALFIFLSVLVIVIIGSFLYVCFGEKHVENLMWEYLEDKGYKEDEIAKVEVKHSFLNILLSYNEWIIRVQYVDEPASTYFYTIRGGKIARSGVAGDNKDKLKHVHP